jgi:hypothetical protein
MEHLLSPLKNLAASTVKQRPSDSAGNTEQFERSAAGQVRTVATDEDAMEGGLLWDAGALLERLTLAAQYF